MKAKDILLLPLGTNTVAARTIGEYLLQLSKRLWLDAEDFSAKRPFGMGDWQTPVHIALVKADIVSGTFDKDGSLETVDHVMADAQIMKCLSYVFTRQYEEEQ